MKQVTAEKVKILFTDGKTWFESPVNGLWEGRRVELETRRINEKMPLVDAGVQEGLLAFPNPGEGAGRSE